MINIKKQLRKCKSCDYKTNNQDGGHCYLFEEVFMCCSHYKRGVKNESTSSN